MNLRDLYILNKKTSTLLQQYDPSTLYNELVSSLTTLRTSPTEELQEKVDAVLKQISGRNEEFDRHFDLIPHSKFLRSNTEIESLVGSSATKEIEQILAIQPFLASENISLIIQGIASLQTLLTSSLTQLEGFGVKADVTDVVLVSLDFGIDSQRETTDSLRSRLLDIEKIFHAFARLSSDPSDFRKPEVYSISHSSPTVIDIGMKVLEVAEQHKMLVMLGVLGKTITWVMDRTEQVYRIRHAREDLKAKKVSNKSIDVALAEQESKVLSDQRISKFVTKSLMANTEAASQQANGASEETQKALVNAIKILVKMIQKGTEISLHLPANTVSEEDTEDNAAVVNYAARIVAATKQVETHAREIQLLQDGRRDDVADPDEIVEDEAA